MAFQRKKPLNPILLPIVSVPHFLLAGILAAVNWNRLGQPQKARNTIKWSIIGTIAIIIIALYFPPDILKRLWSVGIGINVGTGMALRTLQLPEYTRALARFEKNK